MLPDFFVIGAPRSGTTSLYEYLDAHPDIRMSTLKEPDFFARPSLDTVDPAGRRGSSSLDEDAARDPVLRHELGEYTALFDGHRGERRVGEASAVYLGHPTAGLHLHRYLPEARFIAILRDPAERAYSHFVHAKRIYAEHGKDGAVGDSGRSVDEEFARVVDAALRDGPPDPAVTDPEVWVRSGFYFEHLTRWYSLFPREQLAVFLYEDLVDDPNALMARIYRFLDVDDSFVLPTTEAFNASVVPRNRELFTFFTTKNAFMKRARALAPTRVRGLAVRTRNRLLGSGKPPLDADLRAKLVTIYRDDVAQLQDLIGRDVSAWLAQPGTPPHA